MNPERKQGVPISRGQHQKETGDSGGLLWGVSSSARRISGLEPTRIPGVSFCLPESDPSPAW